MNTPVELLETAKDDKIEKYEEKIDIQILNANKSHRKIQIIQDNNNILDSSP